MPKRFENKYQIHFLTFSCYKRLRLFVNDYLCQMFVSHLKAVRDCRKFKLHAFVIMPNHVHLLLKPAEEDTISKVLLTLKKSFSLDAMQVISDQNPELYGRLRLQQYGREVRRLWQAGGGYDRNIYKVETLKKAIDYIHLNPVRSGLVKSPVEYRWSSARFWILNLDEPMIMDIPGLH